jgi:predicted nuclease of predicted toxin-antitoxin system
MLRLVTDEDVHDDIIRGLRRREPALDIVRVLDVGLDHTPDPIILDWAATEGRVLITGDLNTMVGFALDRVRAGLPMPGVLALLENVGIGRVIDDLLLVVKYDAADEVKDQVTYIPLH